MKCDKTRSLIKRVHSYSFKLRLTICDCEKHWLHTQEKQSPQAGKSVLMLNTLRLKEDL